MIKNILVRFIFLIPIILFQGFTADYPGIRNALKGEITREYSISNLAKELGVNRSTLANFLSGEKRTSPTAYKAIQKHKPYLVDRLNHAPQFVMNTIFHLPSKHKFVCDGCKPRHIEWEYSIGTKIAGILGECKEITETSTTSSEIKDFLDILTNTAFENQDRLKGLTSVILLNRMESVDSSFNKDFEQLTLESIISCSVYKVLWQPIWKCKTTNQTVTIEDVRNYYNSLSEYNKFLFLNYERDYSSKIVPYTTLRNCLLQSELTNKAIDKFKKVDHRAPVFIAFTDKDTISFNYVFDKYSEEISKNPNLVCLTSGYKVYSNNNTGIEHIQKANQLDLMIREGMESIIPYSTYYPDLNTILKVQENGKVEKFFERKPPKKAINQQCEIKRLIDNVIKTRFSGSISTFAEFCLFIPNNPVTTECPARFFKDKKGKELTFNESYNNSYLKKLRCCCQSHAEIFDWSKFIYRRIKEFITKKNIQIPGAPNGIADLNLKKNIIISLITTLYKYYSPIDNYPNNKKIDITLGNKNDNTPKNIKRLLSAIGNKLREQVKTISELKVKKTTTRLFSAIGNNLRENVNDISTLIDILKQFFDDKNIVYKIDQAAQNCGHQEELYIKMLGDLSHTL